MSDTPQNDPLLSAFLDGELRPDQRESIEQRIANLQDLQIVLQQWKAQGNAIRSLPRQQLRGDLSKSILEEIERRRLTGELFDQPTVALTDSRFSTNADGSSFRNWRTPFIAIASLAGMILLGFFLLRPDPVNQQLVSNTDPKSNELPSVADSKGNDNPSEDSTSDGTTPEDAIHLDALPPEIQVETGMAPQSPEKSIARPDSLTNRSNLEKPSASRATSERRARGGEIAPGGSGWGGPDSSSKLALKMDGQTANDLSSKETPSAKLAPRQPASDFPSDPAKREMESLDGEMAAQPAPSGNSSRQAVSIPQVYFVEFTSDEQPLAVVSEVFSRNRIELQLPEGLEASSPNSSNEMLKTLASRSSQGLEAIYVVATRSQLSRAMTELSESANISGFEVTSSMLEKMLAPPANNNAKSNLAADPRMDEFIAQSQSGSFLFKDKLKKSESQETVEPNKATIGPPASKPAMAQQLQPFERRQRRSHPMPNDNAEADKQADPLDHLMQSKTMDLFWIYSRADSSPPTLNSTEEAESRTAPPLDVDKGVAAQPDRQEELVQFLLLIRTTRVQ